MPFQQLATHVPITFPFFVFTPAQLAGIPGAPPPHGPARSHPQTLLYGSTESDAFTNPEKIDKLETATAATTLRLMKDLRVRPEEFSEGFMVF